jgi:hypothetical protein
MARRRFLTDSVGTHRPSIFDINHWLKTQRENRVDVLFLITWAQVVAVRTQQ